MGNQHYRLIIDSAQVLSQHQVCGNDRVQVLCLQHQRDAIVACVPEASAIRGAVPTTTISIVAFLAIVTHRHR